MFKSLVGDGAYYFLATMFGRGMGLVLFPIYAVKLLPADYAVVDLLTIFAAVCAVTLALEVVQGLYREFNEHEGEARKALVSTGFWFSIVALSGWVSVLAVFHRGLAELITGSDAHAVAMLLCLAMIWLTGINYFCNSVLRLSLQPKKYLLVSVTQVVFTAAGAITAIYGYGLKAEGVFVGAVIGQLAAVIVTLLMVRGYLSPVFHAEKLKTMLRFSLPLIPSSVGVVATMYLDRVVVKEMMTLTDVGILGTAYRFASIAGLMTAAMSSAITPLIYKHYKEESTPGELNRIFEIVAFGTVAVTLGAYAFTSDFIRLLLPAGYQPASPIIPFLLFGTFLSQLYVLVPGLAIAKKTVHISFVSIAGALINLGLNLLLVSKYGLSGVVLATIVSSAAVFGSYLILGQRHYPIPFNLGRLGRLVGITLAAALAIRWVSEADLTGRLLWLSVVVAGALVAAAWTMKDSLSRSKN